MPVAETSHNLSHFQHPSSHPLISSPQPTAHHSDQLRRNTPIHTALLTAHQSSPAVKMSSIQDKAQYHMDQIDKEVRFPRAPRHLDLSTLTLSLCLYFFFDKRCLHLDISATQLRIYKLLTFHS